MSEEEKKAAVKDFALTKGLAVALLAGVMSACFNLGLESGNEVLAKAREAGASDLFALNPVILLVTLGGFVRRCVLYFPEREKWDGQVISRYREVHC